MTVLAIPGLRTVQALAKHAGKTPTQLKAELAQLADDNTTLIAANEDLVCELALAGIRRDTDQTRIGRLETDLKTAVAEVKRLQRKVISAEADKQRLRRAVIDARPRVTKVPCELVRPYAPEVVLPYVSPVPYRSTANETTQELPIVDLPQQREAS